MGLLPVFSDLGVSVLELLLHRLLVLDSGVLEESGDWKDAQQLAEQLASDHWPLHVCLTGQPRNMTR